VSTKSKGKGTIVIRSKERSLFGLKQRRTSPPYYAANYFIDQAHMGQMPLPTGIA
jgi:hypothetical protein